MAGLDIIGVVLAAGASRRFGASDKLMTSLGGRPLLEHAAQAVKAVLPGAAFAITAPGRNPVAAHLSQLGLSVVGNPIAGEGIGTSVACAAELALSISARRLLLVLGDMPFVTATQLSALIRIESDTEVVATAPGRPPLIFAECHFAELVALSGDQGGRHLVRTARLVAARDTAGIDIDRPIDLIAAEKLFSNEKTIA